ncbi:hypothetical protein M0802_002550 [Mischocyttarus mexicanus]|nr:hypothetical protein M0802_002550 [Mischocyttarus mexicanus]
MVSSRSSSTAINDKNEDNNKRKQEEELKRQEEVEEEEEEEEEEVINCTNNNNVDLVSSSLSTDKVLDFVGLPGDNAILSGKKRNVRNVVDCEGGVEIKGEEGKRTSTGAGAAAVVVVDKDDAEWGRRSNDGPPSSFSMSLDLQNHPLGSDSPQNDSGDYSNIDAGSGTATNIATCGPLTTTTETNNNGLSSITNIKLLGNNREEEESYEGFGFGSDFGSSSGFGSVEVDADGEPEDNRDDADSPGGGSSSAPSPTGSNPFSSSGRKRISSNALASQLYRSGSFNSSGRGSNCDNTDDMYSDVSLEEDFIDLNHRVYKEGILCNSIGKLALHRMKIQFCNLMCNTKQSYETSSRPSHSTRRTDRIKLPSSHNSPPSYGYYPPYPRYIPYEPYGIHHHPIPSCPPSCYNNHENHNEFVSESKGKSWLLIILLIVILLALGIALYRIISKTNQRFRTIRQTNNPVSSIQVQMIQEQMHALADTQSVGEERYARVKQENATLQARILILEESVKDTETRAEERLQTEQRRHRELASRLEREKQLQLENYSIKLQAIDLESSSLRDEIGRLREQIDRVKNDKARLEMELKDSQSEINTARENERQAVARMNEAHHMLQVAKEELMIRADNQQRLEELEQQVIHLQARNKSLEETRDELQAAAAVQAGRELLMLNPCSNGTEKGPSLAAELLAGMSQDQMDGHPIEEYEPPYSISELKQALKEQQEVNAQLRAYIDGILLNIVENYPQLLEVKQAH